MFDFIQGRIAAKRGDAYTPDHSSEWMWGYLFQLTFHNV